MWHGAWSSWSSQKNAKPTNSNKKIGYRSKVRKSYVTQLNCSFIPQSNLCSHCWHFSFNECLERMSCSRTTKTHAYAHSEAMQWKYKCKLKILVFENFQNAYVSVSLQLNMLQLMPKDARTKREKNIQMLNKKMANWNE